MKIHFDISKRHKLIFIPGLEPTVEKRDGSFGPQLAIDQLNRL
jgi:hypothetical protein